MEPITIPVTPNLEGHSAGCGIHGCKCCKAMSRKIRVTSSVNHKSFFTAKYSNCNSRIVIYLLECTKCSKRNQYVGQTKRSLSQRVSGHTAASKLKTNLPLYKHFVTSPDHNFEQDTKFSILEKTRDDLLDPRNSFWINTLETVYPKELKSRYEQNKKYDHLPTEITLTLHFILDANSDPQEWNRCCETHTICQHQHAGDPSHKLNTCRI